MLRTKAPLLATALSLLWTVASLAAATYTTVRLTDSAGCSRAPTSNGSGKIVAFASEADLVPPNNADGNFEIFLRDQKKGITQITDTTDGGDDANDEPSISKSGKRVAFVSNRDLVAAGNADGNTEIFLFDKKTGIRQITTTTGGFNGEPALSGSGNLVVFTSDRDLVPNGNADAMSEIFAFDPKKGTLRQITSAAVSSNEPSVSSNGARIAFASTADFAGTNADGSSEIFLFDKKKGIRQLTNGSGCFSSSPAINASGSRVAFESTCDLAGANAHNYDQIFLFDAKQGITQVTDVSASDDVQDPAVDASGKRIAFVSNGDLVPPNNGDGSYEVFLFVAKKGLVQLSHVTGGDSGVSAGPSLSANGKRIVYELNGEETVGANADEKGEIYQVTEK
jgi:Tol biopolymer transport system component